MEVAAAVEARPWRREDGPPPRVHPYEPGARPLLDIRLAGAWWCCPVRARYDWPSGRVSYQVEVTRPVDGGVETVIRSYWWTRAAMRSAWGGSATSGGSRHG